MRKIFAASAIGLALIAGQAVAANGAAQSLRAGDRVGAALGEQEGAFASLGGWIDSMGPIIGAVAFLGVTYAVVEVVGGVIDEDDSPT